MDKYFDGSTFTMEETADSMFRVVSEFESNKNSSLVVNFYNTYPNVWDKTKQVFHSCFSAARENGRCTLILLHQNGGDFKKYNELFLSNPSALSSFGTWAMYQAIKDAELKFIEHCKTPNNEVTLTATLMANIEHSASLVQQKYEKHLFLDGTVINLGKLQLQVQNREKITGADIGLILEWKNEEGTLNICPMLLQAKRAASERADISQQHEEAGYQFHTLKAQGEVNAVYIFYNCDTKKVTDAPRLATVKRVEDISFPSSPGATSTVEDVLSLSTFMLNVMINPKKFKTFSDRASALGCILNSINENELASVFSLSVDADAGAKYAQEYSRYFINKLNKDNSSDPGVTFKP